MKNEQRIIYRIEVHGQTLQDPKLSNPLESLNHDQAWNELHRQQSLHPEEGAVSLVVRHVVTTDK